MVRHQLRFCGHPALGLEMSCGLLSYVVAKWFSCCPSSNYSSRKRTSLSHKKVTPHDRAAFSGTQIVFSPSTFQFNKSGKTILICMIVFIPVTKIQIISKPFFIVRMACRRDILFFKKASYSVASLADMLIIVLSDFCIL
jgi:hypothetical protein